MEYFTKFFIITKDVKNFCIQLTMLNNMQIKNEKLYLYH